MPTANKNRGEWGEFYAFSKLLTEGALELVQDNEARERSVVSVVEIIRREGTREGRYFLNRTPEQVAIQNDEASDNEPRLVAISSLRPIVINMFSTLKHGLGPSFPNPPAEEILTLLNTRYVSTGSQGIEDFKLRLGEAYMGNQEWGFSVKSMTGGRPTLFNASGDNTNFIFEITGPLERLEPAWFERMESQRSLMKALVAGGFGFKFVRPVSDVFYGNLSLSGAETPILLASLMLGYYCGWGTSLSRLVDDEQVVHLFETWSGRSSTPDARRYKLKSLILEMALGMHAATPWSGSTAEMEGGIILVLPDGQMEGYIARSINRLKDYLFESTSFEAPSRKRHDYGPVYRENGKCFIKLNLQVRFHYRGAR